MPRRQPRPSRLPILGAILFTLTACATLTQSQIKEVKRFAEASDGYTELPGALARAYGALQRDVELLAIASQELRVQDARGGLDPGRADQAWDDLQKAHEVETAFGQAGQRMDAALAVLKTYAKVLSQLVASDYTDALGESSAKLGLALDAAAASFSETYRKADPLPKVGGTVAQVIRAAGGLYVRHRQAAILKETLVAAKPLVTSLTDEVVATARDMQSDLDSSERNLKAAFRSTAVNTGRLPVTTLRYVYDDRVALASAKELARRVAAAAVTYRRAHERLIANTRRRATLKELIEEINALRDEVEAANAVKKKIDK